MLSKLGNQSTILKIIILIIREIKTKLCNSKSIKKMNAIKTQISYHFGKIKQFPWTKMITIAAYHTDHSIFFALTVI